MPNAAMRAARGDQPSSAVWMTAMPMVEPGLPGEPGQGVAAEGRDKAVGDAGEDLPGVVQMIGNASERVRPPCMTKGGAGQPVGGRVRADAAGPARMVVNGRAAFG